VATIYIEILIWRKPGYLSDPARVRLDLWRCPDMRVIDEVRRGPGHPDPECYVLRLWSDIGSMLQACNVLPERINQDKLILSTYLSLFVVLWGLLRIGIFGMRQMKSTKMGNLALFPVTNEE
jgi:hypothetical protein